MATEATRILVLADSIQDAAQLQHSLEAPGQFAVDVGRSFTAGLEVVASGKITAVVLNSDAPSQILGFLRQMRPRPEEVPVVVLSGNAAPEFIREALVAGASDFVPRTAASIRALPRVLARVIERVILAREIKSLRTRVGELERQLSRAQTGDTAASLKFDGLTGLLSRHALFVALRQVLDRDEPATVVLLDVVGMRKYNADNGPDAGDFLLRLLADAARQVAGESAVIARYDSDALALLLPADQDRGLATAGRIQDELDALGRQHQVPGPVELHVAVRTSRLAIPKLLWDAERALS